MKKVLSLMLSIAVALAMLPCGVLAADDVVSIEFCVGDDTLIINGDAVKVEKPYVVGDGVTLVPLRVITEAFGATVEWVESTQSVNLTYPGVNISLQIDNPVAEVNKKAETLLSAPELTESGYTMVPLRFISENFGATVSYDEKTEKITVLKETDDKIHNLIEGSITTKMVGDKYYKWSMENSPDLKMDYRSFDGTYTSFMYDENNYIDIEIEILPDDYNFEKEFLNAKESLKEFTLVKADKNDTDSNKKTMHFQAKDKKEFADIRIFATDKYVITLFGSFENEKNEIKDECIRIASTFDCVFDADETYDLSNVVDGLRTFKADNVNLSFSVPANFYMVTSEDSENEFRFAKLDDDDYISTISVCVYSKENVGGAEKLATSDYELNKSTLNESISTFSGISSKKYDNFYCFEYSYTIDGVSYKATARDTFFELGDYVYNVSVILKTPDEDAHSIMYKVVNSVHPEEIDTEKVGFLMRNLIETIGSYEAKIGDGTITLPNHYEEGINSENAASYINMKNSSAIAATIVPRGETTFSDLLKECHKIERSKNGITVITPTEVEIMGKNRVICLSVSQTKDDDLVYIDQYALMQSGVGYVFAIVYPEISYSQAARNEIKEIISSLVFK